MRISILATAISAAMALAKPALAAEEKSELRDLREEAVEMILGEWNTYNQVQDQIARGIPVDKRVGDRHDIYKRVDLPQFGTHVVYAQKYKDGDPEKIIIQNIYVFGIDEGRNAVTLELFQPLNSTAIRDAHIYPERLKSLKIANTYRMPPGCRTFWRKQADGTIRGGIDNGCDLADSPSAQQTGLDSIIATSDFVLTPDIWWIRSRAHEGSYNRVYGPDMHRRYEKARQFECFGDVTEPTAEKKTRRFRGLVTHDLGGKIEFGGVVGAVQPYSLRLRRIGKMDEDLPGNGLTLTVMRNGEEAQASTSAPSQKISISALEMQITCDFLLQFD